MCSVEANVKWRLDNVDFRRKPFKKKQTKVYLTKISLFMNNAHSSCKALHNFKSEK